MKKRVIALLTLLVLVVVALSGCSSSSTSTSTSTSTNSSSSVKDDITVSIWSEPSSLHAGFAASVVVSLVSSQMFDTLITRSADYSTYEPCLATAWEFQNDNKDLVFTLRDDVAFHNGEKMTAEDVAFSYNTIINAGYADCATSAMDSMEVLDDTHVVLHFKQEYGPALEACATDYMSIFPKAYYENDPDGFTRNPCGTGAYKFVKWDAGDKIVMTANENYWKGAPSIKNVTFKVFEDSSSGTLALESGEIDVHINPPAADVQNLKSNKNLQYDETMSTTCTWVIFNFNGIFAEENLRLAVAHAINKDDVLAGALDGYGEVISTMYPTFVPGYDTSYVAPSYDLELAKEYMAKTEYAETGLTLKVSCSNSAAYYKPMEIIQNELEAIGIHCTIEKLESNAWFSDVFKGADYDLNVVSFSMSMNDFDENYALYRGGEGQNFGNLDDPDLNEAWDLEHNSVDTATRITACNTIQKIMGDKALIVPIYASYTGIAAKANLQGVKAKSLKDYHVYDWSWAE